MGNLEGRDLATVALSIGRGLGKRILTQLKSQAPQTEVEEAGPLLQSERKKKIMRRWPLSSLSLSFHLLLVFPTEWMQQETSGQVILGNEVSCDVIWEKTCKGQVQRNGGGHEKKAKGESWRTWLLHCVPTAACSALSAFPNCWGPKWPRQL